AVLNFINNAIIHNDRNIQITVNVTANGITIADNGKGIAESDMKQIFDRYYRGTNTEDIHGTGLGLAISRDIIEAHGGSITLTSEIGEGTKVEIRMEDE